MSTIGIVVHSGAQLFSNGITQNAYFIYQCLEHLGYPCEFLCNEPDPKPFAYKQLPVRRLVPDPDFVRAYGLIITVTRGISDEMYALFAAAKVPVIGFTCGNNFMQDQEDFVRAPRDALASFQGKSSADDELWIIPSFAPFRHYLETLRERPVYVVPHLWCPSVLNARAMSLSKVPCEKLVYDVCAHAESTQINLISTEPNLSFCKTSWFSVMAAERLFLATPERLHEMFVFNFPEHAHAHRMADCLKLGSKLRRFRRLEMDEILLYFNTQKQMPIFLTHQTNNPLNYVYYELLYFGYPLVHNSPDLDGCGYYYPENDLAACVEQIEYARTHHHKHIETYKARARAYLERVNPRNADVGKRWKEMVDSRRKRAGL